MYARVGDVASVLGRKCVIISYDDSAMTYLVWWPPAKEYVTVAQADVWWLERWLWGRIEEVAL
jgi:hypothetical protein